MIMRDFKVRSSDGLSFRQRKKRASILWLAPIFIACGALYGALQTGQDEAISSGSPELTDALSVSLRLPSPALTPSENISSASRTEFTVEEAPKTPPSISVIDTSLSAPASRPDNVTEDNSPKAIVHEDEESLVESEEPRENWLTHKIISGDTLSKIFKSFSLSPQLLHQIVNQSKDTKKLNHIRPGQVLHVRLDEEGLFSELVYEIGPTEKLQVVKTEDGLSTRFEQKKADLTQRGVSGSIESSLFLSAQRAGLSDSLTMELAKIFQWDIDFALEIRSGDEFRVLFEEKWLDGEKLGEGAILAAEFNNQGKVYRAVRYTDKNGVTSYFTPDGRQLRKDFLRTPVKFSRISSGFTKRRWHPVLKKWRSHKGVDYAAPTGTPVKSAGRGVVTFIGRKGGYGKVIFVQHPGRQTTVYGHLSRFKEGLKKGSKVKQGQLIGYVGQTGLASGPHLHYEFRVKGQHQNPLKVTLPPAPPLQKHQMPAFEKATMPLLAQLDTLQERTLVADASQ
jgi:murein DD-endopeptidase MepM/ murein hydrolase activator NlpD